MAARPTQAAIETVGFTRITSNSAVNVAAQLFVDILDEAEAETTYPTINIPTGDVLFAFRNVGPIASFIGEIYFDDGPGPIDLPMTIFDSLVGFTDFTAGAVPAALPGAGGASPPFVTNAVFSSDSNSGSGSNGVDASIDVLGISMNLTGSLTWADVVDALLDGSLRIGMHVKGIVQVTGGTESDGFVSLPPDGTPPPVGVDPVPEATTIAMWVGLAGVFGLGLRKRRRAS
jgi:hypothetical protein